MGGHNRQIRKLDLDAIERFATISERSTKDSRQECKQKTMAATAFDRRSKILAYLKDVRRASTRTLSMEFGVSEVTIRNDLALLERDGALQRSHGGAEIRAALQDELSFADRRHLHMHEKQKLARAAARLVRKGETILLDNSTSAYQLAQLLVDKTDLRVVTNGFPVAASLAHCSGIEVVLLGGILRHDTASLVGPFAPQMLESLHADCAFVGAGGLSIARGLTDADVREVEVKRAMVHAADRLVALVDASKFGREAFLTFAALDDLDTLVTDGPIATEMTEKLAEMEVHIVVA